MNHENVSNNSVKKMAGEILLDVVTMGLLIAAFGTMFYNGFIARSEGFTVGILSAITAAGLIILFFIGTISCMATKVKKNTLTVGFLVFAAVQLFALVCNWSVLGCLLFRLFTVEDSLMRYAYVITTAVLIVGYIVSIFSYSGGIVDETAGEEEEVEEDDDGEDREEEDEEEEEEDEEDASGEDADEAEEALTEESF